jgi:hypothetical protein
MSTKLLVVSIKGDLKRRGPIPVELTDDNLDRRERRKNRKNIILQRSALAALTKESVISV